MTCLVATVAITVIALWMSGYIGTEDKADVVKEFVSALQKDGETAIETENVAARRGGLAVSGILFAATLVLTVTCCFWAWLNHRANGEGTPARWHDRKKVLLLGFLATVGAVAWPFLFLAGDVSFASGLARKLLDVTAAQFCNPWQLEWVPKLMFGQGVILPVVLAFSACLFIVPPGEPRAGTYPPEFIIRELAPRIRELDQMLYLGALALVCGTLQLSSALSIPLARMPSMVDVKNTIDMCKASGAGEKGNLFMSPGMRAGAFCAASGASAGLCASSTARVSAPGAAPAPHGPASEDFKKPFHRHFSAADCEQVQTELTRVDLAQSVRSLIHSLTLSIGLAFSMMLAAIYVPAMIRMREYVDKARKRIRDDKAADRSRLAALGALLGTGNATDSAATSEADDDSAEEVDADPTHRIAAVLATLSPVIASLVANTLSQG